MEGWRCCRARPITALIALLAACTSTDEIPLDELGARTRVAVCRQVFECLQDGVDSVAYRLAFGDVETCATATWLQPSFEASIEAVRDGRLRYDGAAAARCVRWLETTCVFDALFVGHAEPAACGSMFAGTIGLGEPCDARLDACESGTYCETDGELCGVCAVQRTAGAACGSDRQCLDAAPDDEAVAACIGSDFASEGVCGIGVLAPPAPEDGACGIVGTSPDGVATYAFCGLGLHCPDFREASYCRAPVATGAHCGIDSLDRCGPTDACVEEPPGSGEGTCVPVTTSSNDGDGCEGDTVVVCDEHAGFACADGTCVRVGDGSLGSTCAPRRSRLACAEGLRCVGGVCGAPLLLGAACASDDECASDECDYATHTCVEPPASCVAPR